MRLNKYEQFFKNPFEVRDVSERVYIKEGKKLSTLEAIDPDTGETKPLYTPAETKTTLHDTKSYTKIFHDSADVVKNLSPTAIKIYLYIAMSMTKPNWDSVYLNSDDVCLWGGISPASFYRSVAELIEHKIIARKLGSYLEYWINPNIFYNGDRVRLFRHRKQSLMETTPSALDRIAEKRRKDEDK